MMFDWLRMRMIAVNGMRIVFAMACSVGQCRSFNMARIENAGQLGFGGLNPL